MRLEMLETRLTPSTQLFALSQDGSSLVSVYEGTGPIGPAGAPTSLDGTAQQVTQQLPTLNAYPGTTGGVRVAIGDVTGDGFEDLVTVPGPSAGQAVVVKVFDGAAFSQGFVNQISSFTALAGFVGVNGLIGGAYVATGQVDPSTFAEEIIIGSGYGGEPRVQVFTVSGIQIRSFLAYASNFGGGVRVASAECSGDLSEDIITAAGPGGGPHVKIFNGVNPAFLVDEFFAFDYRFTGGVYVAAGELDGVANRGDVATGAGEGGGPHVKVWCAAPGQRYFPKAETFVSDPNDLSGVRVGVANLDLNSNRQSLYTGEGSGWRLNQFPPSNNSEPRLRSFRLNDYVGGVPVQPGTFNARSRLDLERISLFDPFPFGRAGGLFINV